VAPRGRGARAVVGGRAVSGVGPGVGARLGVDVGGTKTEAVLLDDAGLVAHSVRIATGFGPDAVVASTLDAVTRVCEAGGVRAAGATIGVGIPGRVDPATGTVSHALNLGVESLELG